MTLAITDACTFMEICALELLVPFFSQEVNVHTTMDVFLEMPEEYQEQYERFARDGKLELHNLSGEDHQVLHAQNHPSVFSAADKTAFYLALKLGITVISSDCSIRQYEPLNAVSQHGILWIIECLLGKGLITQGEAAAKLSALLHLNGFHYAPRVKTEMEARLKEWQNIFDN